MHVLGLFYKTQIGVSVIRQCSGIRNKFLPIALMSVFLLRMQTEVAS